MGSFDKLAEARIRAWQERGERPNAQQASPDEAQRPATETLEVQLLKDIVTLRERVEREADPAAREELKRCARQHEVRLLILLERSGRPLAAQQLAERLASHASRSHRE